MRAVSARALGAIVKGMGEECFNNLMPWLLETLTSEVSSVDRSGAAQGIYVHVTKMMLKKFGYEKSKNQ